jgi:hypothetical protein
MFFELVLFAALNYVTYYKTFIFLNIAVIVPSYFTFRAEAQLMKDEETNELLDED